MRGPRRATGCARPTTIALRCGLWPRATLARPGLSIRCNAGGRNLRRQPDVPRRSRGDPMVRRQCAEGLFPAGRRPVHRAPVVICVGGTDYFKEEHLLGMPGYAHDRDMSLLIVDLPGRDTVNPIADLAGAASNGPSAVVVDFLIARDERRPAKDRHFRARCRRVLCNARRGAGSAVRRRGLRRRRLGFAGTGLCNRPLWRRRPLTVDRGNDQSIQRR